MFDIKNIGDMAKIAHQAKELHREQEQKQQEQLKLLNRIANTLDQILAQLRKQE